MEKTIKSLPARFIEINPSSWHEAKMIGEKLHFSEFQPYIFRGHGNATWPLETTIERLAKLYKFKKDQIINQERKILETFKSRAHHYIQSPPNNNQNLEWLSIIQDFGGPTRLLDFTESFYISSFFATESTETDACVWAISELDLVLNSLWGIKEISTEYEKNKKHPYSLEKFIAFSEQIVQDPEKKKDLVLLLSPPRLNERLSAQKGLFLFNCNFEQSFESNLCKTLKIPFGKLDKDSSIKMKTKEFLKEFDRVKVGETIISAAKIVKINLPQKIHQEVLSDLDMMNINYASLFPGIEGFAKYMKFHFYKKSNRMYSFILKNEDS